MNLRPALSLLLVTLFVAGCASDSGKLLPRWTNFVEVEVNDFYVSGANCTFSNKSIELLATFRNKTELNIIAIEAEALINNLSGEKITTLNLIGEGSFGPTEQLRAGSWGVSCYDMDHSSQGAKDLLNLNNLAGNTELVIKVRKITFEDGQVLEF